MASTSYGCPTQSFISLREARSKMDLNDTTVLLTALGVVMGLFLCVVTPFPLVRNTRALKRHVWFLKSRVTKLTSYRLFLELTRTLYTLPSQSHWCLSLATCNIKETIITMPLNIIKLNAKCLNSPFKLNTLLKEAWYWKVDIMMIQETRFAASKCPCFALRHFPHLLMANSQKKKPVGSIKDSFTTSKQFLIPISY